MQKAALFILTILTGFALSGPGLADETLTITLDAPAGESQKEAKSDLRLNHETLGATREGSSKQQTLAQGSNQSAKKEISIGRVGVVVSAKADIRSRPDKKGRALFVCPKDTYLAVVGENGGWYGVLMIDSSTGWIEKKNVGLLDYKLVTHPSQTKGLGSRVVNTALRCLGISYRWGGYSLGGLDCSGFVKAVFASQGVNLPRTARDQAMVGIPVGWSQLQAGDRLYFACKRVQIDHAGIYIGNGFFIHSSASRGGVAVDSVMKPFYMSTLVAARRS
ncbi:MAG TPA: SH3 domain-containing C40 family peptidase [Armatimonadota bacterium]|nr:SH3 domain-containing C40 family peptidase [Armatimonadota bacterium]